MSETTVSAVMLGRMPTTAITALQRSGRELHFARRAAANSNWGQHWRRAAGKRRRGKAKRASLECPESAAHFGDRIDRPYQAAKCVFLSPWSLSP